MMNAYEFAQYMNIMNGPNGSNLANTSNDKKDYFFSADKLSILKRSTTTGWSLMEGFV